MKVEFWVVRVVLHGPKGARFRVNLRSVAELGMGGRPEAATVLASIAKGELCVMPSDNSIAEPVEVFEGAGANDRANARASELAAKFPDDEFRVCMNADLA